MAMETRSKQTKSGYTEPERAIIVEQGERQNDQLFKQIEALKERDREREEALAASQERNAILENERENMYQTMSEMREDLRQSRNNDPKEENHPGPVNTRRDKVIFEMEKLRQPMIN